MLLGAPGLTTSNKDATRNKGHRYFPVWLFGPIPRQPFSDFGVAVLEERINVT